VVRDITANRDNPEGMTQAREDYAAAQAALAALVEAHFRHWPGRRKADN
jgi:hypothetical protein